MKSFCYIDGKIVPLEKAKIGAGDIGVMRAFGIYDGIKVNKGEIFRFEDHWNRFVNSAKSLELKVPIAKDTLEGVITKLSKRFRNQDTVIKLYLTGGPTKNNIEYDIDKCTFYVIAEEFVPIPEKLIDDGCSVITAEYQRTFPRAKTINYIVAVLLQKERKKRNALEILYVSNGKILECSTSNFFIVRKGVIITPKDDILLGITRKVVIEIAKKNRMKIEEREVTLKETLSADEAFLTSSFKDVVPVVKIDKSLIGKGKSAGKPGPLTRLILKEFQVY